MKICLLGSKSYPAVIGGIETHLTSIVPELLKQGHEIHVITGKSSNDPEESHDGQLHVHRVKYIDNRFLLKFSMMSKTLKKVREIRPDLVHAHDAFFGFISSLFLSSNFRYVYTSHGVGYLRQDWPTIIRLLLKSMERYTFRKADFIIAVDHITYDEVKKFRDEETMVVIPNGVYPDKFHGNEVPEGFDNNKIGILSVGRLIPSKGVDILIKSFNILPPDLQEQSRLRIIGTGPEEGSLKEMAKKNDNIEFLGFVPKVEPYYEHSDIFVLPSLYEGMPFTLLEGMIGRNACISTDIADISMRFKHEEDLLLIPPNSIEALSAAMERALVDSDLRDELIDNSYNKINNEYQWQSLVQQINECYLLV